MLKVLNINFRSLTSPQTRDEFHALLNQVDPDIVIGSEIWLHPDIFNAEIVREDVGYEMFRWDRSTRGGGVLVLVSKRYIALRVEQFETECEILWVKVEIVGSKKGKRKVQGVPQSQTAALPRPQEEEETDKSKQAQTEQTYEKH